MNFVIIIPIPVREVAVNAVKCSEYGSVASVCEIGVPYAGIYSDHKNADLGIELMRKKADYERKLLRVLARDRLGSSVDSRNSFMLVLVVQKRVVNNELQWHYYCLE